MVIGGADTGKSTFARYLARGLTDHPSAALVDADLGQSTIGPPATVGLGICGKQKGEFRPESLRFVGSTSPTGHMLPVIVAISKLVKKAREMKIKRIVIDTSGFISGPAARELKFQKIDLVNPTHIVAIEREGEIEDLLKNFRENPNISTHRFKVINSLVKVKPVKYRKRYRERKFGEYFENAKLITLPLEKLGLHGFVPDLSKKSEWSNLLICLCDAENNMLSLGIIQNVDLSKGTVSCITPVTKLSRVKTIQFGSIYLDLGGKNRLLKAY